MTTRVGVEVSIALADAVGLADPDVIAAYPITPQTHIVEHLSELVANGELDAEFVPVESEHSAMSACLGSAASGARTFTATASQGLALMNEVVYVAAPMRLPIVMAVANRALSAPLSIWCDHSDMMSVRDTGWIQIIAENGQQAADNIICSFRIAEDRRVLLPVMVHLDGFTLTHVIEPIIMPDKADVQSFLPKNAFPLPLNPDKPVAMGDFAPPVIFSEAKYAFEMAMRQSKDIIKEVWGEFAKQFGRQYVPVDEYKSQGKKVVLITMGSIGETASVAVDEMQAAGDSVGLARLRLWRPFPHEEMREALKDAELVIVIDRSISYGSLGGPLVMEVKTALYGLENQPKVVDFAAGLGGRDVTIAGFKDIVARSRAIAEKGSPNEYEIYGVRE